jgi:Mn-dependent DtxR family transcriptional regulator
MTNEELLRAVIAQVIRGQVLSAEIAKILRQDIVLINGALKALASKGYCDIEQSADSSYEIYNVNYEALKEVLT